MSVESCKPIREHEETVSVGRLSQLTGFPEDFIKKELLLDDDTLSLFFLRQRVSQYLNGIYGMEGESVELDKVSFNDAAS